MIDWTNPVETCEDPPRPVRVLCTDGGNKSYPVQVICGTMAQSIGYTIDGQSSYGLERNIRLRNIPEPKPEPVRNERWINLYPEAAGAVHSRKTLADREDSAHRVECRRIAWMSDGSPVEDDPRGEVVDVEVLEKVERERDRWKEEPERLHARWEDEGFLNVQAERDSLKSEVELLTNSNLILMREVSKADDAARSHAQWLDKYMAEIGKSCETCRHVNWPCCTYPNEIASACSSEGLSKWEQRR